MAKPRKKPKGKPERDEAREERITMEVVVDSYDESERAMGWYYYLEDRLRTPFTARCVRERAISPLRPGDLLGQQGAARPVGVEPERERSVHVREAVALPKPSRCTGLPKGVVAGRATNSTAEGV
jgi:hypothetical protein